MVEPFEKLGTLYIAHETMMFEKWMIDQAVSAALTQLKKYKGFDGFLKPSRVRSGDFSLTLARFRVEPFIVTFIGIPGRSKSPIIQELYIKS